MNIYLITDGACRGNPGPGAAAWGIYDENWVYITHDAVHLGDDCTNNTAEYQALIKGLRWLLTQKLNPNQKTIKVDHITHISDSKLLVNQMEGCWKVKSDHIKDLHETASVLKELLQCPILHLWRPRTDPHIIIEDHNANRILDAMTVN